MLKMFKRKKYLVRSQDKVFAGVCGGLADYFAVDPVLVRLIWALATIFTGFFLGVIAYIVAIFIIPER
ncbi:MAG: PspC domain-containing protein [Candidatus Woesearchaeota archaeon]